MVLNIVGFERTIPHKIGILTGTNPHILNGFITNSPRSFAEELLNSIPLMIDSLSAFVISMTPSVLYLARALNLFTVATPSSIS